MARKSRQASQQAAALGTKVPSAPVKKATAPPKYKTALYTRLSVYHCFFLFYLYCLCGADILTDSAPDTHILFKHRPRFQHRAEDFSAKLFKNSLAVARELK